MVFLVHLTVSIFMQMIGQWWQNVPGASVSCPVLHFTLSIRTRQWWSQSFSGVVTIKYHKMINSTHQWSSHLLTLITLLCQERTGEAWPGSGMSGGVVDSWSWGCWGWRQNSSEKTATVINLGWDCSSLSWSLLDHRRISSTTRQRQLSVGHLLTLASLWSEDWNSIKYFTIRDKLFLNPRVEEPWSPSLCLLAMVANCCSRNISKASSSSINSGK